MPQNREPTLPPGWPRNACVVGLGYVGLPTAAVLASTGLPVLGVDTNEAVISGLNGGGCHLQEPGLHDLLRGGLEAGTLRVETQPKPSDVFVICVPTGLAAGPVADLAHVRAASEQVVEHLRPGTLVILESTVPPGTTLQIVGPIMTQSGLRLGEDLFLAHCPERVMPGRLLAELRGNDRVIGGADPISAKLARQLYARFVEGDVHLTDATSAELVKLSENAFRDVNIAFANELAAVADTVGVDVWDVIRLANLHPRVNILQPGPGVGGDCIPVDPWFIVQSAPEACGLLRAARAINDEAPRRLAALILRLLGDLPPRVAILGAAYKGGVADTRSSPAAAVVEELERSGVQVRVTDPRATCFCRPLCDLPAAVADASLLAVLADHPEYVRLEPRALAELTPARVVVDARRCLDAGAWQAAGFAVHVPGGGEVS